MNFMFSSRFSWSLGINQLTKLLAAKKNAALEINDLTLSNPTRAGFDLPANELLESLSQPAAMQYEPEAKGLLATRLAIAHYYAERGQIIQPEQIILTASTSEAYSWLFKLLTDQHDEILIPQPSYPLFEFLAAFEGIKLIPYTLEYLHPSGWRIDFDSVNAAVSAKTKAIIIVNPNNPTGSYLKKKEFARLEEVCLHHELALIVDEVFADYSLKADAQRISDFSKAKALTFVLNGFSKMLCLPQMKLGWIVVNGESTLKGEAEAKLEFIADTFLSVNTPVQLAAPHWLKLRPAIQEQIRARLLSNLGYLQSAFAHSSVRVLSIEGGWSAVLEIPRNHSEEELILKLLERENLLVHPGYFFDFHQEAFLIVSLLTPHKSFQQGIEIIKRTCSS